MELYDHERDPGEWYNQAGKPTYGAVTAELKAVFNPKMSPKR